MKNLILISLMMFFSSTSYAGKGYELSKKAELAHKGFIGADAEMKMILINAQGDEVKRSMRGKVLERDSKTEGDLSLFIFSWPADVKGTKMLTSVHKTRSDDQWLYLPTLKRVKRINSSSKKGSFMGSEFSYEDLSSQEVEKFEYKHLGEEKVNGRPVHLIERYPKEKKSGYSKQVVYLDKGYNHPVKVEYFDKKNELLKVSEFSDFTKLGKWWFYDKIHMKNVQTKKQSILTWSKRKIEVKFSSSEFDSKKLAL
jgi:hypothetical protein